MAQNHKLCTPGQEKSSDERAPRKGRRWRMCWCVGSRASRKSDLRQMQGQLTWLARQPWGPGTFDVTGLHLPRLNKLGPERVST